MCDLNRKVREINKEKIKLEAVGMEIGVQASAVGKLEKKLWEKFL